MYPKKLFIFVLLSTILFFAVVVWQGFSSIRDIVAVKAKYFRLQELIGVILENDEVLAMSARMGAASGDPQWEKRYSDAGPILDAAIKEAIKLLPEKQLIDTIASTDAANTEFVKMEKQSFDFVHRGKYKEASNLLFSQQYAQQRALYRGGIDKAISFMKAAIRDALNKQQQRVYSTILIMAAVIIIMMVSWFRLLKTYKDYSSKQAQALSDLIDSEEKSRQIEETARQAEMGKELQTCMTFTEFGNVLTSKLATVMGLVYGAFYVNDQARATLQRFGGYACEDIGRGQTLKWGQGLVGQAAIDKRAISVELSTGDNIATPIGLGSLIIRNVLLVPVVHKDEVQAVIELGSLGQFNERQQAFLNTMLPVIAMNIEILSANIETRELLEKSQIQALDLSVSQIQLKARSDDLQASKEILAQAEERSRLILSSVSDGILGMNTDGRITFINPAVPALLGYTEDEMIGERMHRLMHYAYPDGREFPIDECSMFHTSQDGQPRKIDNEVLWRKDGTSLPVEYSTTPVYKGGQIVGSVIVFRDITERKRAEDTMRESERHLRYLLETCPFPLRLIKTNTRSVLFANQAYAELLNTTFDKVVGIDPRQVYKDKNVFDEVSKRLANGEDVLNMLFEISLGNDKDKWLIGSYIHVKYLGDDCMVGWFFDVTELQRAKEIARENERQLRYMLETCPVAVRVMNNRTRLLVFANQSYADLLCVPIDQLIGINPRQFYKDEKVFDEVSQRLANREDILNLLFEISLGNDKDKWLIGSYIHVKYLGDDCMVGWFFDVTELQRAKEIARENERQLRYMLETCPLSVRIMNNRTRLLVFANQSLSDLVGIPIDQLLGINPRQFFHDEKVFNEVSQRLANGEDILNLLFEAVRANGEYFWVVASYIHVKYGNDDCVLGWVFDVTELRRAKEIANENEIHLRYMLESCPVAVRVMKTKTRSLIFANQSYARMFHASLDKMDGINPRQFYQDGTVFDEYSRRLADGEDLLNLSLGLRTVDGEDIWVVGSYIHVKYVGEDCILGWFFDVTELRHARDAAEAAGQRFKMLFNASTTAHVIINSNSEIVACNVSVLQLLDYQSMDDIFGKHPAALSPVLQPDGRDSIEKGHEMVAIAIASGHHTFEWWHQDSHGEIIPIEVTIVPVTMDGQPHMMCMWHDLRSRLEIERQLRESKEIAEEATKMKSDFLANMSHEIRTPMNAIIGMSHLALQTNLDARQRNYIEKVDAAAKNLLGIINDILDFSKIEAGKLQFESADFYLEDVMEHMADLSIVKAQDKGLELLFDVGTDVPAALIGDSLRLGQVLINLVNNAIKFTEKGEITVGVHLVEDEPGGVRLRFAVTDTGVGLTEVQRKKLFTAFSQADSSTSRKYGGTGLGLTISKRLVEMMDGEIGVESTPGVGSTFHFTARFGLQPGQRTLSGASEDLTGLRVLVVDDNSSAREIMLSMLMSLKFDASAVNSGMDAIAELQRAQSDNKPYGLVLMDWQMPGMDGVE
ncbi:MAG: PAS domain S-box protein, partial [Nitrospirae bacterium]|nr:PAS domain S-box protein [Nitrospirota bacterium]